MKVGLEELMDKRAFEVSGERRKTCLARSMVNGPQVFIHR